MTRNSAIAERRLVQSSSPSRRSWLVLLLAAATLGLIVLGGNLMPAGSAWIAGCTALAVLLWFVARGIVQKVDHRHTEAKMVSEVKAYLQGQPAEPVTRSTPAGPAKPPADRPQEAVPRQSAGFMPLKGVLPLSSAAQDPVVFDMIPVRPLRGDSALHLAWKLPEIAA